MQVQRKVQSLERKPAMRTFKALGEPPPAEEKASGNCQVQADSASAAWLMRYSVVLSLFKTSARAFTIFFISKLFAIFNFPGSSVAATPKSECARTETASSEPAVSDGKSERHWVKEGANLAISARGSWPPWGEAELRAWRARWRVREFWRRGETLVRNPDERETVRFICLVRV
jgi:hypothetical protein